MIIISTVTQVTADSLFGSDAPNANEILNIVTLNIDNESIDYIKIINNGIESGVIKVG